MTLTATIGGNTAARSIWQELELWSKEFASWQKILLANAVRMGSISDETLNQAYKLFLIHHGLLEGVTEEIEIPESITGRDHKNSGRRKL